MTTAIAKAKTVNLMEASRQWASRPADERFWNIEDMYADAHSSRLRAAVAPMPKGNVDIVAEDETLFVTSGNGSKAEMTNWAFQQLCQRAGAPSAYMSKLPAEDAARCLNLGMDGKLILPGADALEEAPEPVERESELLLFTHKDDDSLLLRCITSNMYRRIWDDDILKSLRTFDENGWRVPPARPAMADQPGTRKATKEDVLRGKGMHGLSINVGDDIAPAGLYRGDRNMFAFMVNEDRAIEHGGKEFYRGFFLWNSEEGAASLGLTCFLYESVCGNHIVWNAQGVRSIRMPHVGQAPLKAMSAVRSPLLEYANRAASEDAALLHSATLKMLGDDKDAVLDTLGKVRAVRKRVSRGLLGKAFDEAEKTYDVHGTDPRSVMGVVEGLTRLSQVRGNADARTDLDRAAGEVMSIVF